jgi:hypothetical protein
MVVCWSDEVGRFDEVAVGAGALDDPPIVAAMMIASGLSSGVQQFFVFPQHHLFEYLVPSQGVISVLPMVSAVPWL